MGGGGGLFWSTHIHTSDRLDKPRSALEEARLKLKNRLDLFIAIYNYATFVLDKYICYLFKINLIDHHCTTQNGIF